MFVVVTSLTVLWGQQTPLRKESRDKLLLNLRSENGEERSKAFERLRSDRTALRSASVKTALVDLLDRENQRAASGEGEDYAEYKGKLAETVVSIADWSDSRQVCILANSANPPKQLADHARIAVPCLLKKLKTAPVLERGPVFATLVQALAKGRNRLDSDTSRTLQQAILSGLHDSDASVRISTVKALGRFGGEDMIPELKVVADTDPDPSEGYAIRKWAGEAIAAIQKRAIRK